MSRSTTERAGETGCLAVRLDPELRIALHHIAQEMLRFLEIPVEASTQRLRECMVGATGKKRPCHENRVLFVTGWIGYGLDQRQQMSLQAIAKIQRRILAALHPGLNVVEQSHPAHEVDTVFAAIQLGSKRNDAEVLSVNGIEKNRSTRIVSQR